MKVLAIFCIAICLVACTGTNSPTPISSDAEMMIEEATASTTSIPTPTTTQLPTSPPTATQTPIPTSTNQPTITPSSTPTPNLSTLPNWFSEPSANILILRNKGNPRVTIFNVETGDLQVVNDYTVRKAIEEGFVNEPDTDEDTLSPNGRYQVKIKRQDDGMDSVSILDKETNTETKLFNPFLYHKTLNEDFDESAIAFWSPDGEFLSVLYDKHYYSDNFDRNSVIYKPSGEIFRQYANMDTSWKDPWSPTAPYKMLYTDRAVPCILDVIKNERTCLEEIREWRISENTFPFHYIWSPDGNQLSFIHNNSDMPKTGLCYLELTTNDIKCFITPDDLQVDQGLFATVQYWSPEGNYLVVFFDKFGAYSDVIGESNKVAVVDIDGNNLQLLEGEYRPPLGNPWRSPISSQTD